MARKRINTQQTALHTTDATIDKAGYTEALEAVDTKDKLRDWFTRGVTDARVYLKQLAGETLSKGYDYNETLWLINSKHSEQALLEYQRGLSSLVKI